MLQANVVQYMWGYEGKPISAWVKRNSIQYKAYMRGKSDKKKNLPIIGSIGNEK